MKDTELKIELLYFDECPSWKNALDIIRTVFEDFGNSSKVTLTRIETQEEAVKHQFVGSPTIRLNGKDLFPTNQNQFALGCRIYQTPEGFSGWPTEKMLVERLEPILGSV
ncbi:MAG: hypothetical protein WBD56_05570 [Anaerolineales bacterium]